MAWSMFPTTGELANACYNVYETADGEWLALGALEPKFWAGFCERIGRPDLAPLQHAQGEERARVAARGPRVMRSRTRDEWLARFAGRGRVPDADLHADEVAADPHVAARGFVRKAGSDNRAAPELGADTDAVLEAAGVTTAGSARGCDRGALSRHGQDANAVRFAVGDIEHAAARPARRAAATVRTGADRLRAVAALDRCRARS